MAGCEPSSSTVHRGKSILQRGKRCACPMCPLIGFMLRHFLLKKLSVLIILLTLLVLIVRMWCLVSTEVWALSTLTCGLASALCFFCHHCIFQASKCKSTKSRNPHGDLRASIADLIYNTVSVTKVKSHLTLDGHLAKACEAWAWQAIWQAFWGSNF